MTSNSHHYLSTATLLLILLWACSGGMEEEVLKSYPDGQPQEIAIYDWQGGERHMVKKTGY
ncbi:MAG: hypothetical protein JSU61_05935, partial [Fidelibacterota bacterium]